MPSGTRRWSIFTVTRHNLMVFRHLGHRAIPVSLLANWLHGASGVANGPPDGCSSIVIGIAWQSHAPPQNDGVTDRGVHASPGKARGEATFRYGGIRLAREKVSP